MLGSTLTGISILLFLAVFLIPGCALLEDSPVAEIPASRIICDRNPKMVDGNVKTEGTFKANGTIRKKYFNQNSPEFRLSNKQYQLTHDGSIKTETLIKLDKPTYISYIEIYSGSEIPKLALDYTAEDKSPKWNNSFTSVLDKRHTTVQTGQVIRIDIRRELLYLRIAADAIEDHKKRKTKDLHNPIYTYEIVTPLKGSKIREVKFYERM